MGPFRLALPKFGLFVPLALTLGCHASAVPKGVTFVDLQPLSSGSQQQTLPSGSYSFATREVILGQTHWNYDLWVPKECEGKPSPVVIALHGHGGNSGFAISARLTYAALKHGFILIAPNGQNKMWQDITGSPLQKNDIAFFQKLLNDIPSLGGDPKRIYTCGFSNGGGMSYFLGAYFSERIAAVMGAGASVGAINDNLEYCGLPPLKRPVPCLMEHGMKDTVSGYGMETFTLSQADALAWWAKQIGAEGPAKHSELAGGKVKVEALKGREGSEALLYSYVDSEHTWPGDYDNQYGFVWNDLMWDFFQRHRLP